MKNIAFLLFFSCLIMACSKEGPPGPQGPQGPQGQKPPGADTSTIYGRVYTIDEFTYPIVPVDSVKVTLHISADSTIETMADSAGFYYFHGIGTGTYELTYNRPRFGEMKVFGLTHISGGTLDSKAPDILLLQIPVQTVVDTAWFERRTSGDLIFRFGMRIPYPEYEPIPGNLELYFSKHSDVTENNYLFRMEGQYLIPQATLNAYFAPGDSLYCRIYTLTNYYIKDRDYAIYGFGYIWDTMTLPIYYIDAVTGIRIYPSRSRESALVATIYQE